ncbi:MAG: single-stranded-DNA-specific exonuclease RecJ [Deltaproteobacteria bacterium]|nr:single-stranded-DNA-specific exonuclease RecJ [Deltaproteobacteria bacterium]
MDSITERRWVLRGEMPTSATLNTWQKQLSLSRLATRVLLSRIAELDQAGQFLNARLGDLPDPFKLPDMVQAVERLAIAVCRNEKIEVHGDYDVDGMAGCALIVEGLEMLGAVDVDYHIPQRLKEGYGLSSEAIVAAAKAGVRVVISVDCGISAHSEAQLAREFGIDLIITDHHQPPHNLPAACAVINPQRADSAYPFPHLSGVGVAFLLLIALRKQLRETGWFQSRSEPDLRILLDLVALGTIADLVPLTGVNRIFAQTGLRLLDSNRRIGIRALKQIAGVNDVTASTVGYQLAPRLNAAGRLEDARKGVSLLLEKDLDTALTIAHQLDLCNRHRKDLEAKVFEQAVAAVAELSGDQAHAIVLAGENWHPGVIGIVASRLVDRYHRPTVVIALQGRQGKGSARSIKGFHMYKSILACAEHLDSFGGHEMAAGLNLSQDKLRAFAKGFEDQARASLCAEDLVPQVLYDGPMALEECVLEEIQSLTQLAPFGIGNPEPVFLIENVLASQISVIKDLHLRFSIDRAGVQCQAIAFGMAERHGELTGEINMLVTPRVNRFRGRSAVQLQVRDFRPSSDGRLSRNSMISETEQV